MTWIQVAEECEEEVMSLSCGFFAAVSFRVWITDSLPYVLIHGEEKPGVKHELEQLHGHHIVCLWAVASGCAALCVFLNWAAFGLLDHGVNMEKLRSDSKSRIVRVITLSVGMTFAWCTCFGAHLLALHMPFAYEGLQLRLLVALFQSVCTFLVVLVLDFVSDTKVAGIAFEKALLMIISALGASVGLAWEQAFHTCANVTVNFMAQDKSIPLFRLSNDPKVWALVLCSCIVCVVLPAYAFYITPRMYQMIEEHQEELMTAERSYRASASVVVSRQSVFERLMGPSTSKEKEVVKYSFEDDEEELESDEEEGNLVRCDTDVRLDKSHYTVKADGTVAERYAHTGIF
jgi:hypothetical protein